MKFFLIALVGMYIGRKIGWAISRSMLYRAPALIALPALIIWGALIALAVHGLIQWQQPGLILKIIMGYALGWYVAIPNFGLFNEATIPYDSRSRQLQISILPSIAYVLLSVVLAFSFVNHPVNQPTGVKSSFQDWSTEEREISKHFILSIQADLQSIKLSNERTSTEVSPAFLQEMLRLKTIALQEARLVTDSVLNKAHPQLRDHFRSEYQKGLELRVANLQAQGGNAQAEADGLSLHDRWADWFNANKEQIYIPKSVLSG